MERRLEGTLASVVAVGGPKSCGSGTPDRGLGRCGSGLS